MIDEATSTVTATVPVSPGSNAVAVDPATDTVYVSQPQRADTVSVIDGGTNTVTATIPVGFYPDGVAVDSDTQPSTSRLRAISARCR